MYQRIFTAVDALWMLLASALPGYRETYLPRAELDAPHPDDGRSGWRSCSAWLSYNSVCSFDLAEPSLETALDITPGVV